MKNTIRALMVLFISLSLMLLVSSCAKEQVAAPSGPTQEEIEAAEKAAQAEKERMAREKAEEARAAQEAAERRAKEERERQARLETERQAQQERKEFESEKIYFDFDKSELKPEARATLTKKADYLKKHPGFKVRIEGHCDERGTNEYNIALGERRANSAKDFLTAIGVSEDRISTVSYGEEKPIDPGHNEEAWAKNRRCEFNLI